MHTKLRMKLEAGLPSKEELGAVPLEDGWIRTAIANAAEAALGTEVPKSRNDWYEHGAIQMST